MATSSNGSYPPSNGSNSKLIWWIIGLFTTGIVGLSSSWLRNV